MPYKIIKFDDLSPVSDDFDISAIANCDFQVPVWVSLNYWVATADPGAGGVFLKVECLDPAGNTIVLGDSPLDLTEAGAAVQTPVAAVQRAAELSLFRAVMTLAGSAGSALISGRIMISTDSYEQVGFVDWT